MKRNSYDVTKTLGWQIADNSLFRQMFDHLATLEEHGIGDFESIIREAIREAWEAKLHAQEWGSDLFHHPVAAMAIRLGFDEQMVVGDLAWRRYRAPLVKLAAKIRDEATRLRRVRHRSEVA